MGVGLDELVLNAGDISPTHSGGIAAKVGVIAWVIGTLIVTLFAHWPALGVKVYEFIPAAAVLITAGDQVPVTGVAFDEDVLNAGGVSPVHNAGIAANVGVTGAVTVTLIVVVFAHCPAVGVNV